MLVVVCFVFCVLCFVFCVCVVFKRTLSYQLSRKLISAKAECTTFVQS
jgi:hypothetical protein